MTVAYKATGWVSVGDTKGFRPDRGRIEIRKSWKPPELNSYLDFPHIGQAFLIEKPTSKYNRQFQSFLLAC